MGDEKTNRFDDFQLEEYKNISNSHFESGKQVSTFFRYYLLILSAPAVLLSIISGSVDEFTKFFKGELNEGIYDLVFFYFVLISISGLFIYWYIINIRHDSILYARTVNKVRKYFFDKSDLKIGEWSRYLELPVLGSKPKYIDKLMFFPLALIFTIINSSFLFFGLYLRRLHSEFIFNFSYLGDFTISESIYWITLFFILFHWILWHYLSYLRENKYLKSYSFGIDIDGVMNNQTENFIKWYHKFNEREIKKDDIKEIPVRLNSSLNINAFDEEVIFNCKEYWEELQENENAFRTIKDIHKSFGYRVFLYTHRDWGNTTKEIEAKITEKNYTVLDKKTIKKLTKKWLKSNGLKIKTTSNFFGVIRDFLTPHFLKLRIRLTIEKGNSYITDGRHFFFYRKYFLLLNRFQGARQNNIRFFVEDRPDNAIKLATLVDFVFLFNQPYNLENSKEPNYVFPKNIIRVHSWNEIYSHLKELS